MQESPEIYNSSGRISPKRAHFFIDPKAGSPGPSAQLNLIHLDDFEQAAGESHRPATLDLDGPKGTKIQQTSLKMDAMQIEGRKSPSLSLTSASPRRNTLTVPDRKELKRLPSNYEPPPMCTGALRYSEMTVVLRCLYCNCPLESYDEDTIGLAIVCLETFVQRDPAMAAPFLLRMMEVVARLANHVFYPWQADRYE